MITKNQIKNTYRRGNKQQPDCEPVSYKTCLQKKSKVIYKLKETNTNNNTNDQQKQNNNDINVQNSDSTASSANHDNDITPVNCDNDILGNEDDEFQSIDELNSGDSTSQIQLENQNNELKSCQQMELEDEESSQQQQQNEDMCKENYKKQENQEQNEINKDLYNFEFKHTYSDIYQIKKVGGVVVNQKKYYKYNDDKFKLRKNKNYKFLLPKKTRNVQKTIVLDMDETLIFTFPEVYLSDVNYQYKTVLRPHVLEFLKELKPYYEIVLFTAAEEDYTRRILLGFDILKDFDHLLFRQHMTPSDIEYAEDDSFKQVRQVFTKDLTYLGRQLRNVCIIDDKKQRFEKQPNNGIEIPRWIGKDKSDDALLILKNFFLLLKSDDRAYKRFNFSKGEFKKMKLEYPQIKEFTQEQMSKLEKNNKLSKIAQLKQEAYINNDNITDNINNMNLQKQNRRKKSSYNCQDEDEENQQQQGEKQQEQSK